MFLLDVQEEGYWKISKLRCKKKKRSLELVWLSHFLHDFWRKMFLTLYSIRPNFIVWLPLLPEILNNMCIVIVVSQVLTSQILKVTLALISSSLPAWPKRSGQKFKYLDDTQMEKLCFTQFSTWMAAWLLLTFFIHMFTQLTKFYTYILQGVSLLGV